MTLGEIIKDYRIKNNLSMDAFSRKSGISKAYISLLEKNKHPKSGKPISPSVQCIKQAADAMNMDFDILSFQIDNNKSLQVDIKNKTKTDKFNDAEWRYPPVSNRLGSILKNYRENANLSIQRFSQQLKIEENFYIQIESGKCSENLKLSPQLLKNISTVTGYDIDYIIGAKDSTNVSSDKSIKIKNKALPTSQSESNFHFKTRLEELCLENNICTDNVEEYIGITKKEFIDIKFNRMPTLSELLRIAYVFGVSMDYLIGKTDIRMSTLDKDELELILDYRECTPIYKENIRKRAHDLNIDSILKQKESYSATDNPLRKTGTTNTK